ncbi:hypothetical protein TNCV_2460221 [Trichonephila clavipes]|nr:hypothetical protein TNCV_2460221 [Trichonephila clavipes]
MVFPFKSGNMSVEDIPRPRCPSTRRNYVNIAKIKCAFDEDRRKVIDQISEETNLSRSMFTTMLQPTDLRCFDSF